MAPYTRREWWHGTNRNPFPKGQVMSYAFAFQGSVYTPDGKAPLSPEQVDAHNRATEASELAEWQAGPMRAFVYVTMFQNAGYYGLRVRGEIRTFLGTKLGDITELGAPVADNFGGYRRHIVAYGTNGRTYHGWYMESSGDYARIKLHKRNLRTGETQW